jgi:hypothetical protein
MGDVDQVSQQQTKNTATCTLFEGDHDFGLAASVSFLVRADYAGTVRVGYRGALPPWLGQLKRANADAEGKGSSLNGAIARRHYDENFTRELANCRIRHEPEPSNCDAPIARQIRNIAF